MGRCADLQPGQRHRTKLGLRHTHTDPRLVLERRLGNRQRRQHQLPGSILDSELTASDEGQKERGRPVSVSLAIR